MIARESMSIKFIKTFVIFIAIPIFAVNVILNKKYTDLLVDNYSEKAIQVMQQISIDIDNELRRISLSAATIAHDEEILSLVNNWNTEKDSFAKLNISKQIDSRLNYMFSYTGDVKSVMFFLKDKGYYFYNNPLKIKESDVRSLPWYNKLLNNKGKVFELGTSQNITMNSYHRRNNLSVAVSPDILQNINGVEAVYLEFNTNIFDSIYSNFRTDEIGKMLIVDSHGTIIISTDRSLLGNNISEYPRLINIYNRKTIIPVEITKKPNQFVSAYFSNKSKWMIINVVNYDELTQGMKVILNFFNYIYIIVIVLFLLFCILFFRQIVIPIKELIKKMKSAEKGNFDDEIDVKGSGEIRDLGHSFNKMIFEIKELMIERDLKEKERSREEIKSLQAQINPHFIYNTLNSIRLMAMMAKAEGIKNMSYSFMKLLSATFKQEGNLITIEEEIECLKHYIHIMKVRYGDNFDIELNIEDSIKGNLIIKLILQPIVENAIIHGVSKLECEGKINVNGFANNKEIIFEIKDNGVGMTKEQIKKVLREETETKNRRRFNSIGIINVDRRIKLNHGEQYGISIESENGKFTTVRITLPIIMEGRDDKNV